MKWVENFVVISQECDVNNIASTSTVLKFMQETAVLHYAAAGIPLEKLRSEGKAFILSKLNLSVYSPLHPYDKVKCETWACESKGVSFNRCSRLYVNNVIKAELTSVWALININEHKPCKVSDNPFSLGTEEFLELDLPPRVRIPPHMNLNLVGERYVVYSDLDLNNHMNNTNYPNMFCDFLPCNVMYGKRIVSIGINYLNEASSGDVLKIYSSPNNEVEGAYFFRIVKSNGLTATEAEIILDEI